MAVPDDSHVMPLWEASAVARHDVSRLLGAFGVCRFLPTVSGEWRVCRLIEVSSDSC